MSEEGGEQQREGSEGGERGKRMGGVRESEDGGERGKGRKQERKEASEEGGRWREGKRIGRKR